MSSADKVFLGLSLGLITLIAVLAALGTNYYKDQNTKIVELIKLGVPPVEAICALQDDYGKNPTCLVIAAKQK